MKTNIIGNAGLDNLIIGSGTLENMRYNYIYTTAETGYDPSDPNPPPQLGTTKILLHKIDTAGNLIWANYYSDTNVYYAPYNVYATQDSGVIICGMRYDINNPAVPNICEGFIMKIDKEGIKQSVGIKINDPFKFTYRCYPNPTDDQLHFDLSLLPANTIRIFDVVGRQVVEESNIQNSITINTSDFTKGLYFYIIQIGENSFQGKFIKK